MSDSNHGKTSSARSEPPQILVHFRYEHLPDNLRGISRQCCELAYGMASELPPSAELSAGLRKLLEAKDCFVRAALPPGKKIAGDQETTQY